LPGETTICGSSTVRRATAWPVGIPFSVHIRESPIHLRKSPTYTPAGGEPVWVRRGELTYF
jgi:hypothetical protein